MLTLMSWVESEDYWNISKLDQEGQQLDYYAYRFEVSGGSESQGVSKVSVIVVELISAKLAVGYVLPNHIEIESDFKIGFICQDRPTEDISFVCKLSQEVKKANYNGDDLEKLEYIGFSLEKFYENQGAKYYMQDLRGAPATGEK
ncbi:MAG: hypothetical protein GWM89_05095 [Candidatus Dadabacteria bacterium]|nr:hypothetical protein [Candidatus Dadabacteria bacterium]NIV41588.1 hypothetical protein [Candidatus Dadabacteria bacterium]NIX15150.1 hypothetical protein [Candidatus Dadabacteria bacterium]NIY21795.1 hypothetical protein [Candidatus Dadabacteria bacterium]